MYLVKLGTVLDILEKFDTKLRIEGCDDIEDEIRNLISEIEDIPITSDN